MKLAELVLLAYGVSVVLHMCRTCAMTCRDGASACARCAELSPCVFFFVGTAAILAVGGSKPTVTADASGRIGVEKQMQVPRAPEP